MSSPYGWGLPQNQSSNEGASNPSQGQSSGYSQQPSQQSPSYGFNLQSQSQGVNPSSQGQSSGYSNQQTPSYGFNLQSNPQQGEQSQYGYSQPSQNQQYQSSPQNSASYGQQSVGSPAYPAQQGINAQPPQNHPSMQGQFNDDKYNTKAILGFILVFFFWPAGLALAIMGRNEIKKYGGKGKGLTTASFILCGVSIVFSIVILLVFMSAINSGAGRTATHEGRSGGYSYSQRVTPDEAPSASEGIKPSASNNPVVPSKDGKYATVAEWSNNSDEAKQFVQKAKDMYSSTGSADMSVEGDDTLVQRLTINGMTADRAEALSSDSVKSFYEQDASNLKDKVVGQAKIHVIIQNEKGEVLFDQTYQGK